MLILKHFFSDLPGSEFQDSVIKPHGLMAPFKESYLLCTKDSLQPSPVSPCSGEHREDISEKFCKSQSRALCCVVLWDLDLGRMKRRAGGRGELP